MRTDRLLLALDLGTTTLAGRLLATEAVTVAEAQVPNPQAAFGADIVRRLEAARQGEGERLQRALADGMRQVIDRLFAAAGVPMAGIGAAAAAANPGITCLLRGLPVDSLLFPPHRPPERSGLFFDPVPVGLELPVPLYLFPLVSGYVGGDLVAFLYGQENYPASPASRPVSLFVDLGTNGEMALRHQGHWWATSVAAGPAFEAGGIACGMPARAGAVEGVAIAGDALRLRVIGGGPPRGLCGSGVVAAIAAALEGGLLAPSGAMVEPSAVPTNLARCIVEGPGGGDRALRLYRDAAVDLCLTQDDVRAFQLAKGAVRAGIECLLARAGLAAEEVEEVIVTGAFGLSLSPQTLKTIALLPPAVIDKVRFFPGGALAGVSRFLLASDGPQQVQALADSVKAYPLSGTPAFEKAFLRGLDFSD